MATMQAELLASQRSLMAELRGVKQAIELCNAGNVVAEKTVWSFAVHASNVANLILSCGPFFSKCGRRFRCQLTRRTVARFRRTMRSHCWKNHWKCSQWVR